MKLKKIFNIIKSSVRVDILNIPGGVIFISSGCIYSVKDMPCIRSAEEFAAIFEVDKDKLSEWDIHIDEETERERAFLSIGRGIPLEKCCDFSFQGMKCVLFKEAYTLSFRLKTAKALLKTVFRGILQLIPKSSRRFVMGSFPLNTYVFSQRVVSVPMRTVPPLR